MTPYYEKDGITIFHGECMKNTEWLSADVLVTDPPYGVAWKGISNYGPDGKKCEATWKDGIANDDSPALRDAVIHAWGKRPAVVFGSWRVPRPANTRHRLIWHKQGQAPGPANMPFMSQDEEIYILGDGFVPTCPPMRSVLPTTEARSVAVSQIGHPTPKPVGLMERLIDKCPPGTIADPFAGSGSTLLAARNCGRKCIGIELEEKYCEIAAKRLAQGVLF